MDGGRSLRLLQRLSLRRSMGAAPKPGFVHQVSRGHGRRKRAEGKKGGWRESGVETSRKRGADGADVGTFSFDADVEKDQVRNGSHLV